MSCIHNNFIFLESGQVQCSCCGSFLSVEHNETNVSKLTGGLKRHNEAMQMDDDLSQSNMKKVRQDKDDSDISCDSSESTFDEGSITEDLIGFMPQKIRKEEIPEISGPLRLDSPSVPDEVYSNMIENEKQHRIYNPSARYLNYRRLLIDWISEVCEEYHLKKTTVHIAARYFDRILSSIMVCKSKLQLIAIACILVAAKFNEPEDSVPRVNDLHLCTNLTYTPDLIRQMELMVLSALDWRLSCVTPLNFCEYWMDKGCIFDEDFVMSPIDAQTTIKYFNKYVDFFAELCLQDYSFQQYLPSLVAASIICCSRKSVGIKNLWNNNITQRTGYSESDIQKCFQQIYSHYETTFPEHNKRSGILLAKAKQNNNYINNNQSQITISSSNKQNQIQYHRSELGNGNIRPYVNSNLTSTSNTNEMGKKIKTSQYMNMNDDNSIDHGDESSMLFTQTPTSRQTVVGGIDTLTNKFATINTTFTNENIHSNETF